MKSIITIGFFIVLILSLNSCSSSLPSTSEGEIPGWYEKTPVDPNYLFGKASATSLDMQLAVDKATASARAEIGRQTEVLVQGLRKRFDEEVGFGENATLLQHFEQTTKTVVNTSLSGSRVIETKIFEDGKNWRAYALVQYPIGAANDAFLQQIKKNNELYTRFRSSEAFKELEEEVKKYEEWKEKQLK
ncbi:LPP20 family lipoprotein [Bacteroidota bacterium]